MINLLANARKSELSAARTNMILLRYIGIIVLAFLFMGGALYVSHSLLKSTMASAETLIETNDVKADVYRDTQQQVDALSQQLTGAKVILDQEVRYSKVLLQIGQLMPQGTVLDSLELNAAAFSGAPVTIKAYARSEANASLLQSQLQGSHLFSNVALQGTETEGGIAGYPVVVSMSVTFNRAGI